MGRDPPSMKMLRTCFFFFFAVMKKKMCRICVMCPNVNLQNFAFLPARLRCLRSESRDPDPRRGRSRVYPDTQYQRTKYERALVSSTFLQEHENDITHNVNLSLTERGSGELIFGGVPSSCTIQLEVPTNYIPQYPYRS